MKVAYDLRNRKSQIECCRRQPGPKFILELLAAGQSENDILTNYPGLTRADVFACASLSAAVRDTPTATSPVGLGF